MYHRAVFLDKDGTIIENVPYNVDVDKIRFNPGVLEGVRQLHEAGYKLFIVTNQAGAAHGRFREEALAPVFDYIRGAMEAAGAPLSGYYYCPHHPDGQVRAYAQRCFCRKPNPGLLFQAAREHDLNLAGSWLIGDILNDIEAGRRVDCRTVLIDNGNETEWELSTLRRPHYTVPDFAGAVQAILLAGRAEQAAGELFGKDLAASSTGRNVTRRPLSV